MPVTVENQASDERKKSFPGAWRSLRFGAAAGAIAALFFTGLHHLLISDIWFSLVPMIAAGAVCGLCVAWTYGLFFDAFTTPSWLLYNLLYTGMFGLLGMVSVIVFDPVTTVAALIEANEPPGELIRQAMPMTVIFTLLMAVLVAAIYSRKWRYLGPILLTCIVLVLFLGLNVSVIGLVYFPGNSLHLIAELFGLILVLNMIYAGVFYALSRGALPAPG